MRKLGGERESKPVCALFLSPLKVASPAERVDFGLASSELSLGKGWLRGHMRTPKDRNCHGWSSQQKARLPRCGRNCHLGFLEPFQEVTR